MRDSGSRRRPIPHARRLDRILARLGELDPILTSLHEARGGGWFARALAGVSILHGGVEFFRGARFYDDVLRADGYERVDSGLAELLVELVEDAQLPATAARCGFATVVTYADVHLAAVYDGEDDGRFLRLYVRHGQDLGASLRPVVWRDGRDRVLDCRRRRGDVPVGPTGYSLRPLEPPEPFLGQPPLETYVDRVRAWADPDGFVRGRAVLIKGESGVGKSLLARNLIRALRPDEKAGALVVSSAAADSMDPGDLVDFVRLLRPVGLVLNDAFNDVAGVSQDQLAFFESLHDVGLVVMTWMTPTAGGWQPPATEGHVTPYGLRPGRIDEVFRLDPPPAPVRRALLVQHLGAPGNGAVPGLTPRVLESLVERTDLLPGAHLVELGRRLRAHGMKSWRREVVAVEDLYCAGGKQLRAARRRKRTAAAARREGRLRRKDAGGARRSKRPLEPGEAVEVS